MKDVKFSTPTKKIEIYSDALEQAGFDPLPTYLEPRRSPLSTPELLGKYPLILSTGNRNLFYTHGQFRDIKSLKEKNPEPRAEIGPKTALQYGVKEKDQIVIETHRGLVRMKAHVDERVAEGVVLVPHGWPREANVNLLTDTECREPIMGYPDMKSLLCAIRKA
jgi:anaerobic selenocysteine-containing dehydrogenase